MSARCRLAVILLAGLPVVAAAQVPFEDVFEWVGPLTLDDRPEALNAAPSLHTESNGGWLVVDPMEGQVRTYTAEGRLIQYFGRAGPGPGEFRQLAGAVRMPDSTIVTVDPYDRIAIWPPAGMYVREFRVELRGISSVSAAGATRILVASTPQINDPAKPFGPVLHLIDVDAGRIVSSPFTPPTESDAVAAWVTVTGASVLEHDGSYVVTLPLSDTIWEFRQPFESPIARVPVSHEILSDLQAIPNGHVDRTGFNQWVRSAHFVGQAVPAGQNAYFVNVVGFEKEPRLLWVRGENRETVEIVGSPALVAYDRVKQLFLFRDPTSLEPNRFRYARLLATG